MTQAQLASHYAKMPKVKDDSDDETSLPPQRTSVVFHVPPTPYVPPAPVATVTAAFLDLPDDEIYDVHDDGDRMVQDPFLLHQTCTARERDDMLHEEQEWRRSQGIALLVEDPDNIGLWVDPEELASDEENENGYTHEAEDTVHIKQEIPEVGVTTLTDIAKSLFEH